LPTHLSPAYALNFSIVIICVSVHEGTRLLGMVEANRGEVLALAEQGKDHIELAEISMLMSVIGSHFLGP
jgi:hypothetical protein